MRMLFIVWPAFMAACAMELLVFAFVDPMELQFAGHDLGWSRQSVYTVSFFAVWAVSMGACALTTLLALGRAEVNEAPFAPEAAPD